MYGILINNKKNTCFFAIAKNYRRTNTCQKKSPNLVQLDNLFLLSGSFSSTYLNTFK